MRQRITERTLKNLRLPETGYYIVFDEGGTPGFGARVMSSGVVSFIIDYRIGNNNRKQKRYTIGRWPDWSLELARKEARELRVQIDKGIDPLERRAGANSPLVSDLARDYLQKYAEKHKRASSLRNDRAMLDTIVLPSLGRICVKDVHRDNVEKLHASLKATPYRANRVLSLLSKMFNLAIDPWKLRLDNPAKGVERFPEDRRENWLRVEELEALQRALNEYPSQDAADALRLLILTGSREGEVLNAEWSQFDLKRATWTKPSRNTKQKKIEHVPLNKAALQILERMAKRGATGYLFPGSVSESRARVTLRRPWVQVCKAAGLVSSYQVIGKKRVLTRYRPLYRIHDLRHSFASHLVSKGTSLHIVGKLLGHTQPQTTQRYAHVADQALREAAEQVPWHLSARKTSQAE